MVSTIRAPTPEEIKEARTTPDKENIPKIYHIIQEAEKKGFKNIYRTGESRLKILMPSGNLLDWDLDPHSLDSLTHSNYRELCDASIYAGLLASLIFTRDKDK